MPELKEVFEMVTKQSEPDLDSWREQEQRQRSTARNRRIGAFALVAAIGVVAIVIAINTIGGDTKRTAGPPGPIPEASTHVLFDVDTGSTRPLPWPLEGGFTYAVSPDGDELVFAPWDPIGDDNHNHVYIADVGGTAVRRVTPEPAAMDEFNPRWSPGGQIVFQGRNRLTEEVGNLYLLDPITGSTTKLTSLPPLSSHHWFMSASVRPDGQVILFNLPRGQLEDQVWDLWTIGSAGGEPQLARRDAAHGSYSPDGTKIAYLGRPRYEGDTFAGTSIWLADADGSDPRLLVMAPGEREELRWPRWSPDGTRIAYADQGGGVYVVDVITHRISRVVDGGRPEWLDDDTLIIDSDV